MRMRLIIASVFLYLLMLPVACSSPTDSGLAGDDTSLDRYIVGWGQQVVVGPSELTDVVEIAAGANHSLALKADGTIVAWGDNNYGQCDTPAPNSDLVAIAAGSEHNLGLKADGTIVAWGRNNYGQCDVPEPNTNFVAIAGGVGHSLALRTDGLIVAWGDSSYDQCDVPAP